MGMRRRLLVLVLVAGVLGSLGFVADGAALGMPRGRANAGTTTTVPSVEIGGGLSFSGAVITGPGLARPRRLNAYQAAVFVQSWFADEFLGTAVRESPPPAVKVYRVDVTGVWGGTTATLATYYASDGTTVWIGFPRQPTSTSTPSTRPPAPSGWFVALPRVKQAFAGTAKLVPTAATQTSEAPTTTAVAGSPATGPSSSHRSATPWIVGVIALVVLAAAGGLWGTRRTRARAGSRS